MDNLRLSTTRKSPPRWLAKVAHVHLIPEAGTEITDSSLTQQELAVASDALLHGDRIKPAPDLAFMNF